VPLPDWAVAADWADPVDTRPGLRAAQLYRGDLDGVTEHLDHLTALGVTAIYLTPFFPGRSNHRYDATTFNAVDPVLGGDEALERLIAAAGERGMRVIGDITTNHTGVGHEWFEAARADGSATERDRYLIDDDGEYVAWLDVPSLPKLNWESEALRETFCADPEGVIRSWLARGLAGWRVDVANMTARHGDQDRAHDVARWVREAALAERADAVVIAEHVHDHSPDLVGDGWHGVMNYSGFMKPVWTWLRQHGRETGFLGAPVIVPELPAEDVVATMLDFTSRVSWAALTSSWNLLGSHDTTRVRTLVGPDAHRVDVAVGLLMTMPGTPMLTYGDEIGMEGAYGEDGRRPMPWDRGMWDTRLLQVYRDLISVRRGSPALTGGGLRFLHAEGDAIVFLREHPEETALVHVARDAHDPVTLPLNALPGAVDRTTAYGPDASTAGDTLILAAPGPQVRILLWDPRASRGPIGGP
jgi:alpha-glucosidase